MPPDWSPEWRVLHTQPLLSHQGSLVPLGKPFPAPGQLPPLTFLGSSNPLLVFADASHQEIAGFSSGLLGRLPFSRLWARSREVGGFHFCVPTGRSLPHSKGIQQLSSALLSSHHSPLTPGWDLTDEQKEDVQPLLGVLVGPSIRGPAIPLFLQCPLRPHSSS